MNKRGLSAKLIPNPINAFDLINYSARFHQELTGFFGGTPVFPDRMQLHEHVAGLCNGNPVDYLEFGVWQGESFIKWLGMNSHSSSRFYGFDSFEGLPEDWVEGQPKGTFSTKGKLPDTNDRRASFVVGWFNKTLYPFLEKFRGQQQLVIHIDCDLYSSTLFVLAALDRHILPGTIIIFDEYHSLQHEFAAWLDYRRSFNRTWEPLGMTTGGSQAAVRLVE